MTYKAREYIKDRLNIVNEIRKHEPKGAHSLFKLYTNDDDYEAVFTHLNILLYECHSIVTMSCRRSDMQEKICIVLPAKLVPSLCGQDDEKYICDVDYVFLREKRGLVRTARVRRIVFIFFPWRYESIVRRADDMLKEFLTAIRFAHGLLTEYTHNYQCVSSDISNKKDWKRAIAGNCVQANRQNLTKEGREMGGKKVETGVYSWSLDYEQANILDSLAFRRRANSGSENAIDSRSKSNLGAFAIQPQSIGNLSRSTTNLLIDKKNCTAEDRFYMPGNPVLGHAKSEHDLIYTTPCFGQPDSGSSRKPKQKQEQEQEDQVTYSTIQMQQIGRPQQQRMSRLGDDSSMRRLSVKVHQS